MFVIQRHDFVENVLRPREELAQSLAFDGGMVNIFTSDLKASSSSAFSQILMQDEGTFVHLNTTSQPLAGYLGGKCVFSTRDILYFFRKETSSRRLQQLRKHRMDDENSNPKPQQPQQDSLKEWIAGLLLLVAVSSSSSSGGVLRKLSSALAVVAFCIILVVCVSRYGGRRSRSSPLSDVVSSRIAVALTVLEFLITFTDPLLSLFVMLLGTLVWMIAGYAAICIGLGSSIMSSSTMFVVGVMFLAPKSPLVYLVRLVSAASMLHIRRNVS